MILINISRQVWYWLENVDLVATTDQDLASVVRASGKKKSTGLWGVQNRAGVNAVAQFTISESLWKSCSRLGESGDSPRRGSVWEITGVYSYSSSSSSSVSASVLQARLRKSERVRAVRVFFWRPARATWSYKAIRSIKTQPQQLKKKLSNASEVLRGQNMKCHLKWIFRQFERFETFHEITNAENMQTTTTARTTCM